MKFAKIDEHKEIMDIFKYHKEWFPHIRSDKILRMIESGNCIYQNGVIITFNQYKRAQQIGEKTKAKKGDWILHQIATKKQGKGVAGKLLEEFFKYVDNDLWLTVRSDNKIARKFYEKMGMIEVDDKTWSNGTLKGKVYKKVKDESNQILIDEIIGELLFEKNMSVEEYTLYKKWLKIQRTYKKRSNPFFKGGSYPELDAIKNNIWIPKKPDDYLKLKPKLLPVVGKDLMKQRQGLTFISSTQSNNKIGRQTRYIVIDDVTGKYLGLLDVGGDLLDLGARDKYIGWSREIKTQDRMINHLIAGRTIMPTQPFGYNYLGGKLLALLCLSNKVIDSFSEKYGDIIVGVSTTSLYGSFSQYNSLKYWRKCGHSKGSVKLLPSEETISKMKQWLKNNYPEKYKDWWERTKPGGGPLKRDHKNRSMAFVYSKLGIDKELVESRHERGIYYAPLYTNTNEFLRKEIKQDDLIKKFDNRFEKLVELWKEKYASKRVKKLVEKDKFSYDIVFYDDLIELSWPEVRKKFFTY